MMKQSIRFADRLFGVLSFLAVAVALWGSQTHAATYNWTPTASGTYNWNNSGPQNNWGTGFPNAVGDTVNISHSSYAYPYPPQPINQTISLNKAITIGTLNIGGPYSYHYSTTLQDGTGGSLTFDVDSGSAAINYGGFDSGTNIGATITLKDDIDITYGPTISGNIGESGGAKALTKLGAGTLTLSGANTYTGKTTVNGGVLAYGANNVIATGGVTVNGGGLNLGAYSDTVGTVTVDGGGYITGSGTLTSIGTFEMKQGSVGAILGGSGIALNKTTTGTLTLTASNTYTGKTTINGGILQLSAFKGAIAGKDYAINHGSLVIDNTSESLSEWAFTSDWLGNIPYKLNPASGTLCRVASATDLALAGLQPPASPSYILCLEDAGRWGPTDSFDHALLVEPQSNGSLNCRFVWRNPGAQAYCTLIRPDGSVFYETHWPGSTSMLPCPAWIAPSIDTNNANRIADDSIIALNGGNFVYNGANYANSSETIGALNGTGNSSVTVSYGGAMVAELTAASLEHSKTNGSILVNGANLGQNSTGSSMGRFIVTKAPTLAGTTDALATGIITGMCNTKIVPFLIGEVTSTSGGASTATGTANTFVTYTLAGGLRPLNPTDEFTNNAITTGNNTRITSATTATSTDAINSLVIDGANLALTDGITLTNTSGAFLFVSSHEIKALSGQLAVGSTTEYMVTVNAGILGKISAGLTSTTGTECLTKSGAGKLILSGVNTYGGDTAVTAGTLSITHGDLSDLAAVTITAGALLDLNFNGTDTVGSLWLDGLNMGLGIFGATTQPLYFTGNGSLVVVPEPSTLTLLGSALLGLGVFYLRRRGAKA